MGHGHCCRRSHRNCGCGFGFDGGIIWIIILLCLFGGGFGGRRC